MKSIQIFMFVSCLLLLQGCGTESQAKPYVSLSADEEARQALEAEDYASAVERYEALIRAEPTRYERYPLLASAYAGAAGFDLIKAAQGSFGGDGQTSLIDQLGSFLPQDPSLEQIEAMRLAKETILALPAEHRDKGNAAISYASGASLQLDFYQAAYAILYIKQFRAVAADGTLDTSRLESMSEADAENILENFEQIAASGGSGVAAGANQVLAKVEAQEGTTRREKLIQYLGR